ncbi:MAG: glycosyltransferase family 4 protein [Gemmatimonadota bacterium]
MRSELLLTLDFPPMGGGIARWMAELARRYPAGELVVSTARAEAGGVPAASAPGSRATDESLGGAVVDRLDVAPRRLRSLPGLIRWSYRASWLVSRYHPSFVWCGQLRPAAYPANWLHRLRGVPYGILLHGGDLLTLGRNINRSRVKRRVAKALVGGAAVLVANSEYTASLASEVVRDLTLERPEGWIRVVPLGTDPDRFRPGIDAEPFRIRHGLPEGRWLLTVARLVPHKGVDVVLRAMAALRQRFPDLRYAVVGHGSYRDDLVTLRARLGLTDRVFFLADVVDDELPACYNLADVYVGVSRRAGADVEGFGISLVEASASGKPVIAGTGGGMAGAVRDGETGLLIDGEDPHAVAEAVRGLLENPARARGLGLAGREWVERFYNWERVVSDLRAISEPLGRR